MYKTNLKNKFGEMWASPSYTDLNVIVLIYYSTKCKRLGLIKQELKN